VRSFVGGSCNFILLGALEDFHALPIDEDFEGSLVTMRSAIDIAIQSLMKLIPLSKRERGDLKSVDELPTIAQYLAKDELSRVDIILANEQLIKLGKQLSASKEMGIHRQQAEALIHQSVAILNLIASTVKLPDNSGSSALLMNSKRSLDLTNVEPSYSEQVAKRATPK
jgi:hypothetical protein